MLIIEQRTTLLTAPVYTFNQNVALLNIPKETYLSGERILAAAVLVQPDPQQHQLQAMAKLVNAFIATRTLWQIAALINYLNTPDLHGVQIAISTDQANYLLFNGNMKKTVAKPMIVTSTPKLANFLYHSLGLNAEFSVAFSTALKTFSLPKSESKIFLSRGFVDPSHWENNFGLLKSFWLITSRLLALPFKRIYS